jgi:hypothetical protein
LAMRCNMTAEYSADFRSAVDELSTAIEYALSKFREQDSSTKSVVEVQEQGAKLRQINRLARQMHDVIFPETQLVQCSDCQKSMYVEKAFWQGICWECASART